MAKPDLYWLSRLKRDRAMAQRAADQVADQVRRAYRGQYYQIERRLESLYAQAESRGTLTRTQLWNYSRWREMRESMASMFGEGVDKFRAEMDKRLERIYKDVIGVDYGTMQPSEYLLHYDPRAVIDTAWSGESYSTRIWGNTNQLAQHVQNIAQQVVMGEKSLIQCKRELMDAFNVTANQAARLADTEVSYVLNKANLMHYEADGVSRVTIVNLDVNTCDKCKAIEGEVFIITDAPALPIHPNCHCSYCVPADEDNEPVTASGANLEELYARKGVKGYEKRGAGSALAEKIDADPAVARGLKAAQAAPKIYSPPTRKPQTPAPRVEPNGAN